MVLNLFEDYENKSCKQTGRLCANHRERLIENVFIFLFKSCFSDILILFCKRFAFCCSLRPYILQPTSLQHNIVIILVTFSHPFNPPPPQKKKHVVIADVLPSGSLFVFSVHLVTESREQQHLHRGCALSEEDIRRDKMSLLTSFLRWSLPCILTSDSLVYVFSNFCQKVVIKTWMFRFQYSLFWIRLYS